jgi:hypothetical protein
MPLPPPTAPNDIRSGAGSAVGPPGPVGPAGPSGVSLSDESIPLTGNPHTTMNFVGPGVTVTDAGSGTATVTIPSTGAVVFDGGATSQNVRTNRALSQSPINAAKEGIVNLSSKTAGPSTGATGDYSTISGGDQGIASGDYSVVAGGLLNSSTGGYSTTSGSQCTAGGTASTAFGLSATASGDQAFAVGSGVTASGPASVAMGASSNATGDNSTAIGFFCSAFGDRSSAVGYNVSATGDQSTALGSSVSAARRGELAHSSGNGNVEGLHAVDLFASASAAPVNLVLGDSTELVLDNEKAYSVRVRIVAREVNAPDRAHTVHELLVMVLSGVLTIDDDFEVVTKNTPGWTMSISSPGGSVLRISCDPGTQNVNFGARVEWACVSAPS